MRDCKMKVIFSNVERGEKFSPCIWVKTIKYVYVHTGCIFMCIQGVFLCAYRVVHNFPKAGGKV